MAGNDAFTKILLHFDGADSSTTITDSNIGGSAHTWSVGGVAQLDTGVAPKFGTASLLNSSGATGLITTPSHADFALGSSDFTIDLWFNSNEATNGTSGLFAIGTGTGAATAVVGLCRTAADVIEISISNGTTRTLQAGTTQFTNTVNPGWHHAAFVRTGNICKLFVDGVQEGADLAFTGAVNSISAPCVVGDLISAGGVFWIGNIDEVRLSVGIARWTANFTLPTAAYSAGYDLPADSSTYSLSGQAAVVKEASLITAQLGTYAISGQLAGLTYTPVLPPIVAGGGFFPFGSNLTFGGTPSLIGVFAISAELGTYTLIGQVAGVIHTALMTAEAGSYLLSGQQANLKHTNVLTAELGTYAVSGQDALLSHGSLITAQFGTYTLSGQQAELLHTNLITAQAGAYTLAGQNVEILKGYQVAAEFGTYTISGQQATFFHTNVVTAEMGTYILAGQAASIVYFAPGAYTLPAAPGSYTVAGQDAPIKHTSLVTAQLGTYTVAGQDALLKHAALVTAQLGTYALSGQQAGLLHGNQIAAQFGTYTLGGQDANLIYFSPAGYMIPADMGVYSLSGQDAGLLYGRRVVAEQGTYTVIGQDAELAYAPAGAGGERAYVTMIGV